MAPLSGNRALLRKGPHIGKVLTSGVQLYYALDDRKLKFVIEASDIVFRSYARPAFEARLSPQQIYSNTAFLLTLILITPGMRFTRRSAYLAMGATILYLTHVGFLITKVEMSLIASNHPLGGAAFFWEWADNFFEIMGNAFFPVFIWLLLTLRYMMGEVDRPAVALSGRSPGRNEPCPCGSGEKYKHCCGRV